jgi:CSLREA domain-containing protein
MRSLSRSVVLCALVALSANANTITVTGLGDSLANDGVCTLREAIINANNDAATWSDCAAGSGADVINLPAGTIHLAIAGQNEQLAATGDLDIRDSVTINGNAAGTTIDGGGLDRIFEISPLANPAPGTLDVTMRDLYLTNGSVHGDGGAIWVGSNVTLTMERCTIAGNSTNDDGGGMFNNGATVHMTNCTVSGNSCPFIGGGIRNLGILTLTSCTVTNNSADPTRGQGVADGAMTFQNTIIAGNNDPTTFDIEGDFTSQGYNVLGSFHGSGAPPVLPSDQINVTPAQLNLGPLTNNGGTTPTHLPGAGSVAIDQGNSAGLTTDQRGLTRPCDQPSVTNAAGGDGADVGAVEVQGTCVPPNTPPVASPDSATVLENSSNNVIDVLANDTDADGDTLTITAVTQGAHGSVVNNGTNVAYTPNANFFGSDSFTYTISDGHGGSDSATVTVTVKDSIPPVITLHVTTGLLWPPNHDLVNVGLSVSITDNSGSVQSSSIAVFSNEDDVAPAAGDESPDAKDIAAGTLRLRAERSGSGAGRFYLIVVTATDPSNNTSHNCATVVVPKSLSAADLNAVAQLASAAQAQCTGAGLFVVGDGPLIGPKQ